jgi:hypothetical protein
MKRMFSINHNCTNVRKSRSGPSGTIYVDSNFSTRKTENYRRTPTTQTRPKAHKAQTAKCAAFASLLICGDEDDWLLVAGGWQLIDLMGALPRPRPTSPTNTKRTRSRSPTTSTTRSCLNDGDAFAAGGPTEPQNLFGQVVVQYRG